ncbi:hypothetical protein ABMA28_015653 [Loxostege sticticalis]|uniref:Uncharacterized protein n=1 Tax=Loxostege sticticalis TaxID=481309 RepID=A0ABD0TAL6_LOXSC
MSFVTISVVLMAAGIVYAQIRFDTKNIADGKYAYMYNDGLQSKDETGNLDSDGNSVVTGQYRYVLGDKEYVVTYTADKDGFYPKTSILEYTFKIDPKILSLIDRYSPQLSVDH